jgi:hypothetical protein
MLTSEETLDGEGVLIQPPCDPGLRQRPRKGLDGIGKTLLDHLGAIDGLVTRRDAEAAEPARFPSAGVVLRPCRSGDRKRWDLRDAWMRVRSIAAARGSLPHMVVNADQTLGDGPRTSRSGLVAQQEGI